MSAARNGPRALRRRAWLWILAPAGLVIALVFGLRALESKLLYLPARGPVGASPGEEVELVAADGVRLHGWFLGEAAAGPALLYLHGNAGSLANRRAVVEALRPPRGALLAIDWRGYGQSEGEPDEQGLYQDALAAWDWLAARADPARIVVVGESLGGGPATWLARERGCAALVLLSTFTSVPAMARRVLPIPGIGWLARTRMDNLARVAELRMPKLFVHSRADEVVPFAMGERLFAAAAEPKRALWFDGLAHNETFASAASIARLRVALFEEPGLPR